MTFITPFCSCKWRGYLGISPIALPGISGGFAAWCPWSQLQGQGVQQPWSLKPKHETLRSKVETQQDSSKYPLPVSEGCWQVSENLQLIYVFNAGLSATAHFRARCSSVQYQAHPPTPPHPKEKGGAPSVQCLPREQSHWGWSQGRALPWETARRVLFLWRLVEDRQQLFRQELKITRIFRRNCFFPKRVFVVLFFFKIIISH